MANTGGLAAVDKFMVGTLKGVGRVYLQSGIDCCSRYAWGRLYTTKMASLPCICQHGRAAVL